MLTPSLERVVPNTRRFFAHPPYRGIAFAATTCIAALVAMHRADAQEFGVPPSGEIPILYNDRTVYATPDRLRDGRVLAAIAKDGRLYVPFRSMLEQMGATVTVSSDGRTIAAARAGANVSVTVGAAEVVVNGESRPLDVPPIVVDGVVLAPVRVLTEAMGAYVAWIAEKRLVVVRYKPSVVPTPMPTAAPTIARPSPTGTPAPVPTLAATPSPRATSYGFIAAAFAEPKTYNEFSIGAYCSRSYSLVGAYAFGDTVALKLDYRQDDYLTSDNVRDAIGNHYTQFATIDGGTAITPEFLAKQSSLDARLLFEIAKPHIDIGPGYLQTTTSYGYPALHALGVGIDKLPDLHPGIGGYASYFYYPSATGTYTIENPTSANFLVSYQQKYAITKFDIGLTLVARHIPVYAYGGFQGDRYTARGNAPIGQTHDGPYAALGLRIK